MENQTAKQQEAVDKIYEFAANLRYNEKKSADETVTALVAQGLDLESATAVVTNLDHQVADTKKERAKKDVLYGALWCVGGIVVTAVTYSSASGGGTYVVAWGAIIFGAVQLIKGVVNSQ